MNKTIGIGLLLLLYPRFRLERTDAIAFEAERCKPSGTICTRKLTLAEQRKLPGDDVQEIVGFRNTTPEGLRLRPSAIEVRATRLSLYGYNQTTNFDQLTF